MIYPAKTISLILSDIIGSPLGDIGSGPTISARTPDFQALDIITKYRLHQHMTPELERYLSGDIPRQIINTAIPDSILSSRNHHFVIGDINMMLSAARESAVKKGISAKVLSVEDRGEARDFARQTAVRLKDTLDRKVGIKPPVLLLSGGELTVSLKGRGRGGRNQEFVLQLLQELRNVRKPFFILSMGTDGIDGPTDAAGAWIDQNTMDKVIDLGLDIEQYLNNNDSYSFFKRIDQLLITGPTGTNVMDFRMFYIP